MYIAKYALSFYHRKMEKAKESLGGVCVSCGSKENLQFDHIDPSTKIQAVSSLWSYKERFWEEVKKCQLLCLSCHNQKSVKDLGKTPTEGNHGTDSCYMHSKCRCDDCKEAHNKYMREYKRKYRSSNVGQVNR